MFHVCTSWYMNKKLANQKCVVLILSTKLHDYDKFKNSLRATWIPRLNELGVPCFFYEGGHAENRLNDDTIELTTGDGLEDTSAKLKSALVFLKNINPDFDFIYRTNLSSYIDPANFIKYIVTHSVGKNSYIGLIGETTSLKEYFYFKSKILCKLFNIVKIGPRIRFASGSGFFLGSNHIQSIVNNSSYDYNIDDIMVSRVLRFGPSVEHEPLRFDISNDQTHKIKIGEYKSMVNDRILFHYRFKTDNRDSDARLILQFADEKFRFEFCTITNESI